MDAYSRLIVGWSIAGHMRTELVTDALGMAIIRRQPEKRAAEARTVLHPDHGLMSCTGPNGRGVSRSSQAPSKTQAPASSPARNVRTTDVLPMPAPPLSSATRPRPTRAAASAACRSATHGGRIARCSFARHTPMTLR
jgi:hypothetical protein